MANNKKIHDDIMELYNTFAQHWTKTALIDAAREQKISYQNLWSMIENGKRILLNDFKLTKGQTVCLIMSNSLELAVLYFSALCAGIVVAPLDPEKSLDDINHILHDVKPALVITDSQVVTWIEETVQVSSFSARLLQQADTSIEQLACLHELDYESLFLITFTSGSTGKAKGVMHSFGNLAQTSHAFAKKFNFNHNNIWYHNLPMSYMAGILNQLVMPLLTGGCVVIGPRFSVRQALTFWDIPITYSVNTFWFVPTMLSLISKLDRSAEGAIYTQAHNIIGCVGTAPLTGELKQRFQDKYGIGLYQSYGLSETLFISTQLPDQQDLVHSVGALLDGVTLSFDNDEEIIIDVPWMFLGYLGQDACSQEHYKSGDLGKLDEQGLLHVTGRKKDLIIRGGLNISPKKIEDVISALNVCDECVIVGLPHDVVGEKITCFYVAKQSEHAVPEKDIQKGVYAHLGKDYLIDSFIMLDALPKNSNGKIDKLLLQKKYGQSVS